jgi:asparagine synthase (glutamine-hydrolysing)
MVSFIELEGWIELQGQKLSLCDVETVLSENPGLVSKFGGEFFLKWNGCMARDHFGIMAEMVTVREITAEETAIVDCPSGAVVCNGLETAKVDPDYPLMDLGDAIEIAVRLRSDEGVVALSGGVDSALVAQLAGRECVVVGIAGSHDLRRAEQVAAELGLPLEAAVIDPGQIEDALSQVLRVIPRVDPVNASIATTLYFVAKWAGSRGYRRILAGQGADELFGGYARYLQTDTLAQDMGRDFQDLGLQLSRDQAVAGLYGAYFSLPYMDTRVVKAALAIPPEKKVCNGVRKLPLRDVAKRYLPPSIAMREKKAMQYGSGVAKEIERLANRAGFKGSFQGYLDQIANEEDCSPK